MDLDIYELPMAENGNKVLVLRLLDSKVFRVGYFRSLIAVNEKHVID